MSKHFLTSLSAFFVALALLASAPFAYAQNVQTDRTYYGTVFPGPRFGLIEDDHQLTEIGWTNNHFSARYRGLAYRTVDQEMYAEIRNIAEQGAPALVTINTATGNTKSIIKVDTHRVPVAMTYDPASDLFYTMRAPHLKEPGFPFIGTSDPTTGEVTALPNALFGTVILGIAIDPDTGIFYGAGMIDGSHDLVTFDKETGLIASTIKKGLDLPQVQSMTVRNGKLLVTANGSGTPEVIVDIESGGKELWEISFDGETTTLLNNNLGNGRPFHGYVDAIEYVPAEPVGDMRVIQPGDVNIDGQIDTNDIVQILGAGKYEEDVDAVFGDGDVDGAPNPAFTIVGGVGPPGDNRVNSTDIVAILGAGLFETGQYAAQSPQSQGDGNVVVTYEEATGNVSIHAGEAISSFQVESAAGIFTAASAQELGGPFDVDSDVKIFKATFGDQFSNVDFGPVAQSGLSESFLLDDLSTTGSFAAGGTYGDQVELNHVPIPEPSTVMLLGLGALGLLGLARRRA